MSENSSSYHLVFKTELRVTASQAKLFRQHFGASRFAYNCLLNWVLEEYAKHNLDPQRPKPRVTRNELQKTWVHTLRDIYAPWHATNSTYAYRHGATSLATAYTHFFNGTGKYPTWKRKRGRESFSTDGVGSELLNSGTTVKVPFIGHVRLHERLKGADWLQRMGASLQEVVYSSDPTGRFYVSLRYRAESSLALAYLRGKSLRKSSNFVGIDLGLKEFGTFSNGEVIKNPRFFQKLEQKLAKEQKRLSTKKTAARRAGHRSKADNSDWDPASKSQEKAKLKVASTHRRIRNQRKDFINKLARKIVNENSIVAIEDLNIEAMKSKFGKSVSDASPAEFRRTLSYMAEYYGTQVIVVDRWFPSSKTCSNCKTVKAKLSLFERTFECNACGLTMDRDLNAAVNLKHWAEEYLAHHEAARYADSLNGRGAEDLIASGELQHKSVSKNTDKASHESKTQEQLCSPQ